MFAFRIADFDQECRIYEPSNVEAMNPLMNSLLNKEVVRVSGRLLVRVGDQEIDFNNNFLLFMMTMNHEAKFTPTSVPELLL
jgi:hypothetical protein